MTSDEARRTFLAFFDERDHRVVPSSPLVLPNDPTLLFANAGMNQFKDVFTGKDHRDYSRAVSSQKCMRVSGKHNDLEMVGRTPRHHTFFEMLGNFSFGDYFKKEAIEFAWELITGVYAIPRDRLWVTVFGGSDAADPDDDAEAIWRDVIGVDPGRVLRLGEKDNFWRMGDTGPCGPCSEIHFDLGEGLRSVDGRSTPETDERRYVEIWNLVFMEFDQQPDGSLVPLPAPSVDTGMGLERIAAVLQDKRSNYDTDLLVPLIVAASDRAGVRYGDDPDHDVSLRVIADHARAVSFLVADGVIPANDNRGYVARRILRRAIRHGRKLGIDEPFLHDITPVVLETLGETYPELLAARDAILEVTRREELQFSETLSTGLQLLERAVEALPPTDERPVLPGKELFRLYDTYGLPLDLAGDIAEEQGFVLDTDGFEAEMAKQRARAQASWKGSRQAEAEAGYRELADRLGSTFEGYDRTRIEGATVLGLLRDGRPVDRLEEGAEGEVVLDPTPFYAEAGGQIGDTGTLSAALARAAVLDTRRPADGLIVSRIRVDHGELAVGDEVVDHGELAVGDEVVAQVDEVRRDAVRRNHTATHLVHAALREIVGSHVKQAGSLVAPDRLRFDFSHFAPLTDRAVDDIERLVNEKILDSLEVTIEIEDLDRALREGAMALFGEKYGDRVRVVRIGDFSTELCGGTHCDRSSEVGLFKVNHERGIASGTRRIEAITGDGSLDRFREAQGILRTLEEVLAVPRGDLVAEIEKRLDDHRKLQRELESLRMSAVRNELFRLADEAETVGGVKFMAQRVSDLKPSEVRALADNLRRKLGSGVVVIGRADEGKASLLVAVTDDLTDRLPAGDIVREMARIIGGGGGGRKDLAEAGGKDPARLDEALEAGRRLVRARMEGAG